MNITKVAHSDGQRVVTAIAGRPIPHQLQVGGLADESDFVSVGSDHPGHGAGWRTQARSHESGGGARQGFVDGDQFECLELADLGPADVSLPGVRFDRGMAFDFTGGTLAPTRCR